LDNDTVGNIGIASTSFLIQIEYFEIVDAGTMTPAYIVFSAGTVANPTYGNLQINTLAYSN